MLKFTMNSYKSGSLSVLCPELCVASGTLVQHHAPGSSESAPAQDDPSVVQGVAEFVAVPSYSAWFQNVLWILDHEADKLLELVSYGELEV